MSKTILVVDDEQDTVRLLQFNLEKAGYRVITAENGQRALECVASNKPDLILMDHSMPVMDGLEALKHFKGNPATAEIPVVILTANASYSAMSKGWESGTDLYLTKPIMASELTSFIERILS